MRKTTFMLVRKPTFKEGACLAGATSMILVALAPTSPADAAQPPETATVTLMALASSAQFTPSFNLTVQANLEPSRPEPEYRFGQPNALGIFKLR